MRFAVATGRAPHDPTPSLRGALPAARSAHVPAITDPEDLGELLRAIDGFKGQASTKAALPLTPRLFVGPGELRRMEWTELDLEGEEGGLWTIPWAKMKGGVDPMDT